MDGNNLNYKYYENGENSCMENYRMNFDIQDTYRIPRRRGRPIANNAARERSRVKTLRSAFLDLQRSLPAVPPDTKLSKLDVLVLATTYIAHLMSTLQENGDVSKIFAANGGMHPVKVSHKTGILLQYLFLNPDPAEPGYAPPLQTM